MRYLKITALVLLLLWMAGCGSVSAEQQFRTRCDGVCGNLPAGSAEAQEGALLAGGLPVMDTESSWLDGADGLLAFLEAVRQGTPARQEVFAVWEPDRVSCSLFENSPEGLYLHGAQYDLKSKRLAYYECHEILDWTLTDRGNFYYRTYPAGDKHFADYQMIRTVKPDGTLTAMTDRYIRPVGYVAVNLFLTDWQEGDWKTLSFNDLWGYFSGIGFDAPADAERIPAAEFEKTMQAFFRVDTETLRTLARYDGAGDSYPYRGLETNDFIRLDYCSFQPEVTACQENPDGTLTLTVEALSTDLKTDCLFAHQVTVRPLTEGRFQYVSNRVTYQTEYGLPYCEPRLSWD